MFLNNQKQRRRMGRLATLSALSVLCFFNAPVAKVAAQQRMTSHSERKEMDDGDGGGGLSAGKLRSLGEEASIERRFDDALGYINRAIRLEPENALNHYRLFQVHKRMRRLEDAVSDLTNALEIDRANSSYRKERAKLRVILAQCDLAVEDYRVLHQNNAVVDQPSERDAYVCAQGIENASRAFQNNDYDRVILSINSVLQYTENASDLLFMRAKSSFEIGDYYTAVSDTAKILKLHSSHLDAYQLRGDAYFYLGEFEAAGNHYRLGLKYDPEHKGCKKGHKTLKSITKKEKKGDDALAQGSHEEALKYWSQAIEEAGDINAFTYPTLRKMVVSYSATGNHDRAIDLCLSLVEEEETIEHYFVLGDAQMAADKFDESMKTFRTAFDKADTQDQKEQAQERVAKAETALKQSKTKNYYKILGISRTATSKEIKKAYREQALEWHPDKNANNKEVAERMFMDINEANEVLSNDELRAKYDRGEDVFENQGGGQGHNTHQQQFFHGGGGQQFHFRFN